MEKVKLPISAVIVTRNESKYLNRCLEGVDYCDEIVVIDLNSSDDSPEVALAFGAKVIRHPETPFVELVHANIHTWVRNTWVLITDPDEVADMDLKNYITMTFMDWTKEGGTIGSIRAPMIYYVGRKPFYGTGWGPTNKSRVYIVNLARYEFTTQIHRGRKLREGFDEFFIDRKNGVIHHYWVESLGHLIHKCRKYLRHESGSRVGKRKTSWELFKTPFVIFYSSFVIKKGYKDGLLGLALSIVLSWYDTNAYLKKK